MLGPLFFVTDYRLPILQSPPRRKRSFPDHEQENLPSLRGDGSDAGEGVLHIEG